MSEPTASPRWWPPVLGLAVFVITLGWLLGTSPFLAIVWDEGYTLGREERVRNWFRGLSDPVGFAAHYDPPTPLETLVQSDDQFAPMTEKLTTRAAFFDVSVMEYFWPFAREEPHGHPPFYAIVGMLGDVVARSWAPLLRARVGPIVLFSLTAWAIFVVFQSRLGLWPAIAAAAAWSLQPRLFAHAHYAHYDGVLTSLWTLAILCFVLAVEDPPGENEPRRWPRPLWVAAFGITCGLAAGTKLTGWFLCIPFIGWSLLKFNIKGLITLMAAAPIGVLALFAVVPTWWLQPVLGPLDFLQSNLTRHVTTSIPIEFLGTVYNTPRESLPWYNTLAWTAMVTPVLWLLLAAGGMAVVLRRFRTHDLGLLVLLNWLFLILLRALPGAPGHDGVRQFLPAFGCLALLVGVGAASLERWRPSLTRLICGAAIAEGLVSVLVMMPVPLSYYSPLIGGLPGARAIGMEATYYWDALDPATLDWLNASTPPGRTVRFNGYPTSWLYLRLTGQLAAGLDGWDRGDPLWYVVQNRTGMLRPIDRHLIEELGPQSVRVSKLGVPLVWVFPIEAVDREGDEMRQQAGIR